MNYPIQYSKTPNGVTVISCTLNTDHKDVIQDALTSMQESFDMVSNSVTSLGGVTVICGVLGGPNPINDDDDEPYHFISSNGDLYVNSDGSVNHEESDLSDWLTKIDKVDLEELRHYYKLNKMEGVDLDGDVLDFGWWDEFGAYHEPDMSWRAKTFHNQEEFSGDDIEDICDLEEMIDKSKTWIAINRRETVVLEKKEYEDGVIYYIKQEYEGIYDFIWADDLENFLSRAEHEGKKIIILQ